MADAHSRSAAAPKQAPLRGREGPHKLALSSETSSSDTISPKQRSQGKRMPSDTGKKMPPPPFLTKTALGSLYVATQSENLSRGSIPGPKLAAADPLLSVESPPGGFQRIKSAVIVRASSTTSAKRSQHAAASMELRPKDYQLHSRFGSKTEKAKPGKAPIGPGSDEKMPLMFKGKAPPAETAPLRPKGKPKSVEITPVGFQEQLPPAEATMKPKKQSTAAATGPVGAKEEASGAGPFPPKPRGKLPAAEKPMFQKPQNSEERIWAASRAESRDYGAKASTPSRSTAGPHEAVTKALMRSDSSDAWNTKRERDAFEKGPNEFLNMAGSPPSIQLDTAKFKASTHRSDSGNSKVFSKQRPKLPSTRASLESKEDLSPWPDMASSSSSLQKRLLSGREGEHTNVGGQPTDDHGLGRDAEDRLSRLKKRVNDLESLVRELTKRHHDELDKERSQHRINLGEEINKVRADHAIAIEQVRKAADAKIESYAKQDQARIEEIKREALARQNSMKMHCEASVRDLKEQVASLEKQLKDKAEQFEKEKHSLLKSFENKRQNDIQAQERKALVHQDELKSKDAELLEQQSRVQALASSLQTLTTSLAQMKELNDVSRTATQALEEKAKTQTAYIKTLMKREDSMRSQAAKMMPIKEAKRLAFRALLKGRAVEMISRAFTSTDATLWNKAWAFQQLVYLIGGSRGSAENRQDAIESRLLQFRKEQMFLMAENERLMAKVAQLQQEGVNQRQSKAALMEQALLGESSSCSIGEMRNKKDHLEDEPHARWLVLSIQNIVNKKVLWAFLRLQKVTTEAESNTTIDQLQKKFNELRVTAYKEMTARIGWYRIISYIRGFRQRLLFSAFFSFAKNAGQFPRQQVQREVEKFSAYGEAFFKEPIVGDMHFFEVGTSQGSGPFNFNVPLAHQPHYYSQLPSVRKPARGRNLFLPMVEPSPPLQGYMPHPGYSNPHLTLGVPPVVSRGRTSGASPGVPNVFPSGPYDATQRVDECGAVFRIRGTQQELRRMMADAAKGGARIVGKKLQNTTFRS